MPAIEAATDAAPATLSRLADSGEDRREGRRSGGVTAGRTATWREILARCDCEVFSNSISKEINPEADGRENRIVPP